MAECAQCLYENAAEATSCEQCGADLAVEALSMQLGEVCRSCDSYNDPGVRVCVSCGSALGSSSDLELPELEEPTPAAVPGPLSVPAPIAQPWMASPETPHHLAPVLPSAAVGAGPASATAPAAAPVRAPGKGPPLPPGALPPGWAAFQQKQVPSRSTEGPVGAHSCPKCSAENPPTARFCGTCGTPLVAATEGPRAKAKLILIRGISGEGRQFPLGGATNIAGRGDAAIAFSDDPYIAALHATFLFRGDDLLVKDEGAGNGIYVRLREPQALRPGDMFVVGERLLRYVGPVAAGSPVGARHGSPRTSDRLLALEEVLEGGGIGRVCKRAGPIVTIGRAGCDLNFPADGFVSARHAELSIAGDSAFLRDLGSANGTFLRVQPRSERRLSHGDYLLMGRELLRVELSAAR